MLLPTLHRHQQPGLGAAPSASSAPAIGGPTGQALYNWTPNWVLGMACPTDPRTVIEGSACWVYNERENQLYTRPPMPVTPALPVGLPANPLDGPSAQATVDAVIRERAERQQRQTADFFANLDNAIEADRAANQYGGTNDKTGSVLMIGLAVAVFLVVMRRG